MADIFISYSRKDSPHAISLAEQLRSNGIDVWIDQHGIVGAEQWATEIAEGIRSCSTFIILLSPESIGSENVLKELSLASEKRKRILPVDLYTVELPSSFEYALAGLQRVAISDFDKILQAHKHGISRITVKDTRKSLIVLPFEDLSPGQDNGWLADGMASELIDSLSHIKSLRLIDRKTSMDLKGFHGKTQEIADALQVRYFIQGSVRKFGEQIKISTALLDIETGDFLWQESHKGEFKDIFDIQEAVAQKVVDGLKLHLSKDEQEKLLERGTENAEAYELYIKANEYFSRQTREGSQHAIQLLNDSILLDPGYAYAYQLKSNVLASLYRKYERNPAHLLESEELIQQALRIKPDMWDAYHVLSVIYRFQNKLDKAEMIAQRYIEKEPDNFRSHFSLACFYDGTGQFDKAIAPYEEAIKLAPDHLTTLWNLVITCQASKEREKLLYWASNAIPYFERHLKLHPDDEVTSVNHACLLYFAGRNEESRKAAKALDNLRDGSSLHNTACLWGDLGNEVMALTTFMNALKAGYKYMPAISNFLKEYGVSLHGTPEYEEAKKLVESIEAEQLAALHNEGVKANG